MTSESFPAPSSNLAQGLENGDGGNRTHEVFPANAAVCTSCELHRKRADSLLIDLENAETEMRVMRRKITTLQNELARQRKADPNMDAAERIFEYWRKRIQPRAKAFGADRQKAVLARLNEGRTELELKQAIEGARIGAFVDQNGKRHDDLELICRSDRYVLRFIGIFERAEREAKRRKRLEKYIAYARTLPADLYGLFTEDDVHAYAEQMLVDLGGGEDEGADADSGAAAA